MYTNACFRDRATTAPPTGIWGEHVAFKICIRTNEKREGRGKKRNKSKGEKNKGKTQLSAVIWCGKNGLFYRVFLIRAAVEENPSLYLYCFRLHSACKEIRTFVFSHSAFPLLYLVLRPLFFVKRLHFFRGYATIFIIYALHRKNVLFSRKRECPLS